MYVFSQITSDMLRLKNDASEFASKYIKPLTLNKSREFPLDLWNVIGEAGFLGLLIPKEYGGSEKGYLGMCLVGESLVASGHNLGLVLSIIVHNVIAKLVFDDISSENIKDKYLSRIASGLSTVSFAISEPEVGAHPKYLKTTAVKKEGGFSISGEKSHVTNGPIADYFVVIAITGTSGYRKMFSAFIVPCNADGLTLTQGIPVNSLHPSPHCGIKLENCWVSEDNTVIENHAYEKLVIPFRSAEDVGLMGPILGGMSYQLSHVVEKLKEHNRIKNIGEAGTETLGHIAYLDHTLRLIAYETALILDKKEGKHDVTPFVLSFRALSRRRSKIIERFVTKNNIPVCDDYEIITRDLWQLIKLASNVLLLKQRKIGEETIRCHQP
ncbi:MAG: acyl-CoA dehydrogenase family protein [Syntrophales bacterium]|nr:acyl-CoA dehydrogenase family protein [Syntrophales bacterium]